MDPHRASLAEAAAAAARRLNLGPDGRRPRVGIVLGSGLGSFADELADSRSVATADLPYFPISTVAGHAGRLVAGSIEGVSVLVLQGRVHAYEGYAFHEVAFGVRVLRALEVEGVCLTNAAGALRADLRPGTLLVVADHLRAGLDRAQLDGGSTRPTDIYGARLRAVALAASVELGLPAREGCLVYHLGPSYETAAEVRLYRQLGGDAACMSTVPEALAAHELGLEVLALSCITNPGTGLTGGPLRHEDVTAAAHKVSGDFRRLLREIVRRAYG